MIPLNYVGGEYSWESLGQQGDQTSKPERKSTLSIGKADAEVEAPICWPHDLKSHLIVKDPDAGKDRGQDEKGVAEDEMVG